MSVSEDNKDPVAGLEEELERRLGMKEGGGMAENILDRVYDEETGNDVDKELVADGGYVDEEPVADGGTEQDSYLRTNKVGKSSLIGGWTLVYRPGE